MENKPKKMGNMKLYVESSLQEMTIAVNYINHGMPVLIAEGGYLFYYLVKS
jgi:hypothetical protein